jgi:phenylpropionate dioxygenase-like ring-hydroxylating dioxygenase large terminal subunit
MTMNLNALLGELREYLGKPDAACLSLPREAYIDTELYDLEIREIFEKSWLCVGREEYVPNPGDYYTIDVMGEPVIIVRGRDGKVRALSAVCRHRAMPVVQDKGNAKRFTCPYHAWTYGTDGHLIGAPHMEQSLVFDKKACSLPQYRLDNWLGFMFVNLDDDAAPLAPVMASMEAAVAHYRIAEQTEIFHYEAMWTATGSSPPRTPWSTTTISRSMRRRWACSFRRGTPTSRPRPRPMTALPMNVAHGRKFLGGASHPMNPKGDLRGLTEEELTTGYMVYVFPAFTMAMRPGTNNWLSFRPNGPEKTRILGGYLMWRDLVDEDPELSRARREMIERVNQEDSRATTELAKAMRSRKTGRGPLSHFEGTVAQFYKYLARTLTRDRVGVRGLAAE